MPPLPHAPCSPSAPFRPAVTVGVETLLEIRRIARAAASPLVHWSENHQRMAASAMTKRGEALEQIDHLLSSVLGP